MTKKIQQNNKLIAEFMGLIQVDSEKELFYYVNTKYINRCFEIKANPLYVSPSEIPYHLNWHWLMPVKEKIEILDCVNDFSIGSSYASIEGSNPDDEWNQVLYENEKPIEKVYLLIIDFLKWYNKNKLKYYGHNE